MEALETKIDEKRKKLNLFLLHLIKTAVSKQIKTTGKPYVIGPGWENRSSCEISPNVQKDFKIKLRLVDSPENNYVIAQYIFTEKIFEIFKDYSVPAFIEVSYENESGEHPVYISDDSELRYIKSCFIPFYFTRTVEELDKLEGFMSALEKQYLFTIIKN